MENAIELKDLRTKEEVIQYFKGIGQSITEEEIEALKKSYEQANQNNNNLTMKQLDNVVGGTLSRDFALLSSIGCHYVSGKLKNFEKINDAQGKFSHFKISFSDFTASNCQLEPMREEVSKMEIQKIYLLTFDGVGKISREEKFDLQNEINSSNEKYFSFFPGDGTMYIINEESLSSWAFNGYYDAVSKIGKAILSFQSPTNETEKKMDAGCTSILAATGTSLLVGLLVGIEVSACLILSNNPDKN